MIENQCKQGLEDGTRNSTKENNICNKNNEDVLRMDV